MKKFGASLAAIVAAYVPMHLHTTGANDVWDTALFLLGLVLFALATAVTFVGTHAWGARSLGLFWVCLGLAVLFARALIVRQGWVSPQNEVMADAFRAMLLVGGGLLLYGLLRWVRERFDDREAI